jgi:hypothetical protein
MIEFYLQIKVGARRGGADERRIVCTAWHRDVRGRRWRMAAPLRYLRLHHRYRAAHRRDDARDLLHQYPFVNGLTTKVLLLVVYVVLGSLALSAAHAFGARG